MTIEAETGVMPLQAMEWLGLPATTRSWEEVREDAPAEPPEEAQPGQHP